MRPLAPLLLFAFLAAGTSAHAQRTPGGPSGDFRVNDRPGTAPTVGAPGGPSLPPNPMMFRDGLGPKSPDEILKSIDKDLGHSAVDHPTDSRSFNLEKDLRSPSDKFR